MSLSRILSFLACLFQLVIFAQVEPLTVGRSTYVDALDLRMIIRGDALENDSGLPEEGQLILFAVPIFGSNPLVGFFFGLGATGAMYVGDPATTSISNLSTALYYTTQNQFVANIRGIVMTNNNSWLLLPDIKYTIFSENTFGLGTDNIKAIQDSWNIGGIKTTGIEGAQALKFNNSRFHLTGLKSIKASWYLGLGYHLDIHNNISDLSLDLTAAEPVITTHYAYNMQYGFNPERYRTAGASLNVIFDNRDHTVNSYSGMFCHLNYRENHPFMGSSQSSRTVNLEVRAFKSLSSTVPRHVLGIWTMAQVVVDGQVPYMHLPAHAYDMRNRIGRGYVAGRWRGPGWVTVESEYRFPITQNGLIGGVVFASGTTTSRDAFAIGEEQFEKLGLFEAIRPAAGIGGRVMLNRSGRLNLTVDMAWGQNGAKGFYLAVGETF